MTTTTLPSRWNGASDLDGFATPRSPFARLRANLERLRHIRKVAAELQALSDRDLDDIGIARADIWDVARGKTVRR